MKLYVGPKVHWLKKLREKKEKLEAQVYLVVLLARILNITHTHTHIHTLNGLILVVVVDKNTLISGVHRFTV